MGHTIGLVFNLMDVSTTSYAADAVGTTDVATEVEVPRTVEPGRVMEAYVALSYVWAPTAAGTFQLVDDAGNVIAESSAKSGGESATLEKIPLSVSQITRMLGRRVHLRINITTAGAAGETVTLRNAQLVLILYVER